MPVIVNRMNVNNQLKDLCVDLIQQLTLLVSFEAKPV